jgi:YfiH family protein
MRPEWEAPASVGAWMSSRAGGVSAPPYDTLNLGAGVGDDPAAVRENRARFAAALNAAPVYLKQVHGARVVRIGRDDVEQAPPTADAACTTEPGIACTVLVADCMPVLLAAPEGRAVAAAHAGWRGLAAGVIEAALAQLCELGRCQREEVAAWLGPCIGPRAFEVGADVLQAFGANADGDPRFVPRRRADGSLRWLADLPRLGRDRLAAAGVEKIAGGRWCTVEEGSRFFSFRRDGVTGRLGAAVWIRG